MADEPTMTPDGMPPEQPPMPPEPPTEAPPKTRGERRSSTREIGAHADALESFVSSHLAELSADPVGVALAQRTAADYDYQAPEDEECIWVMSNRVDNRNVLFERDPRHPGGEAFVGGDGVDFVAKTPSVEGLLRQGLLLEIPEPPLSRRKPIATQAPEDPQSSATPGQAIRLGREPLPELVPEHARAKLQDRQDEIGGEIPVSPQTVVPPRPEPVRTRTGRQAGRS